MQRFLFGLFFTLTLIISAAGAAPAAHAQNDCPEGQAADFDGNCFAVDSATGQVTQTGDAQIVPEETGLTEPPVDPKAAATPSPYKGNITDYSFNGIMAYIVQLFAWLLGVGAVTLDNAVYYTVVTMGNYVNHLSAIGVTWRILRDIGNILLIFGFLAVGITTILNVEWYGGGKKMLPMMFVAAVFLNFSLFISEAVIDTGNLFATQFYQQINGGNPAGAKTFGLSSINNEGISNKIMSNLGLQTIYGEAQDPKKSKALFDNYWTIGFMSIILFLVAAFVFFALAFVLIARFVILIFLIILAPVGFAGLAIPMLKKRADQWWAKLFEQTITAPILLLMLYIALAVITDVQFLTGFSDCVAGVSDTVANSCSNPSYIGFTEGNFNGFASVILSFLVAMGLLILVVIQSKNLAAFGAAGATKLAGKLTFGATAFAGRRTVGRLSNYTARKIRSSGFGRSDMGKLFAGVADKGAKASFDVRGIKAGGGLKALGGLDAGEAQKGGYHGREEELIKSRIDYAKSLKQTTDERTRNEGAAEAKEEEEKRNDEAMEKLKDREQAQLQKRKDAIARGKSKEEAFAETENEMEQIHEETSVEKKRNKAKLGELNLIIKQTGTSAIQKQYGKALERKTIFGNKKEDKGIPRFPYDWSTAVGSARAEAAHRIIGEANKDPSLKKLDEIANALGKTAPASSSAPAPVAPAPH